MSTHIRKKKSIVWNFFDKDGPDSVTCKICHRSFRFHSNTSNMKGHLKSKHAEVLDDDSSISDYTVYGIASTSNAEDPDYAPEGSGSEHQEEGEEKEILSYAKLVVPMSMRSNYWKCFGFPAREDGQVVTRKRIVCLLCKNVISYNRNTSNLKMHLKSRHPDELAELELSKSPPPQKSSLIKLKRSSGKTLKDMGNLYTTDQKGSLIVKDRNKSNNSVDESGEGVGKHEGKKHKKQVTLVVDGQTCTIESLHPFVIPMQSQNVSETVAEFVIMDMQSPDIVEGQGFQRMIANLRSPCEIPSKARLVDDIIPRFYDTVKENLLVTVHSLAKTKDVSLTVEEWDSASGETYVTFSICYQQEKGETLKHKVLSTVHCPVVTETSYWMMVFNNLLEEWQLNTENVKAVVCGNVRNEIIEMLLQKGLVILPCFVHTLQEVVSRVCFEQEEMKEIISKCRAYISVVYKFNISLAALKMQDHLLSLEEVPLVSDQPRVWISTYMMLEAILARKQVITTLLENVDEASYDKESVTFTEHNWNMMEESLSLLEPFKVTMVTLAEEKCPLASLLKPLLWQLVSNHLQDKDEDSVSMQLYKTAMRNLLTEKYSDPVITKLLRNASSLDPRFKNLDALAEETKLVLEESLKEELEHLIIESRPDTKPAVEVQIEETPEKKKPRLSGFMMLMRGELGGKKTSVGMTPEARAQLEVVQYQSESEAPVDQCPLIWWGQAEAKCRHLARLAERYLCVPACVLSPARLALEQQCLYEQRRALLTPETVDRMVFLKSNFGSV